MRKPFITKKSSAGLPGFWSVKSVLPAALLATGMLCAMAPSQARATFYYWDPEGVATVPYTGNMTGLWENNDWSTSAGGGSLGAFANDGDVVFGTGTGNGTPAFTVTMNAGHTVEGLFIGSQAPNSCTVTVNGTGVLTLASPNENGFNVINASDGSKGIITFNNVIAGATTGAMILEGNGVLNLYGTNTYTGKTCFGYSGNGFDGTIGINNSASFGAGTIWFSNTASATAAIILSGSSAVTIPNAVYSNGTNSVNIVANAAGLTFSGAWDLGASACSLNLGTGGGSANLVTISGIMSDAGGLTVNSGVTSPGTLALTGANTFTGGLLINGGVVQANTINDTACSIGTGAVTLGGGTLSYTGSAAATTARRSMAPARPRPLACPAAT